MTKTTMDLSELLAKHDQGDFLRSIAEAVLQLIMEADVDGLLALITMSRRWDAISIDLLATSSQTT